MTSEMDQRAHLPARTAPAERPVEIDPPDPGMAMLACRCGAVLDAADMHRAQPTHRAPRGCLTIRPIVCARCA